MLEHILVVKVILSVLTVYLLLCFLYVVYTSYVA